MDISTVSEIGLIASGAALMAVAVITDLRARRISNSVTGSLTILGLAYALFSMTQAEAPIPTLALSLGTASLVLLGGMGLFALGVMGGGDVKLMAAFSLFAGPAYVFPFLMLTAIAGGLVAGVTLIASKLKATRAFAVVGHTPDGEDMSYITEKHSVTVPYGVAIALAGWWICFKLASQAVA